MTFGNGLGLGLFPSIAIVGNGPFPAIARTADSSKFVFTECKCWPGEK